MSKIQEEKDIDKIKQESGKIIPHIPVLLLYIVDVHVYAARQRLWCVNNFPLEVFIFCSPNHLVGILFLFRFIFECFLRL